MRLYADDDDGLTLADLQRCLCEPHGLEFAQLAGFPPPGRLVKGAPARWACADLLPWLQGFFRGIAATAPQVMVFAAIEAQLRPGATPAEHRERAIDRWVSVSIARVCIKQAPP